MYYSPKNEDWLFRTLLWTYNTQLVVFSNNFSNVINPLTSRTITAISKQMQIYLKFSQFNKCKKLGLISS